ncbi:MAG: hypothetical protein ABW352_15490 [Polyangiales bacterium]
MKRWPLAISLACACQREPPAPPPPPPPPAVAHTLRVLDGDAKLEKLPTGLIELPEGARWTVAIDDGVRIELHGPGRYALSGDQLLVHDGLVSVDVAAQAVRAGRHAFTVATPAGQLEVPFAARLVLRAPAHAASELALISGEALADGTLPVGPKARVCFAAVGPHALGAAGLATVGFATVEAALEALPGSRACADDQPAELAKLQQELARQLEQFTRTKAEQDALIASYAKQSPPGEQGRRLVQDLAARGQLALTARSRALVLRAQLAAAELGAAGDPARAALLARANQLENPAH